MTGKVTEERKYLVETSVACYEVDRNKKLKPSAFLDIAQEAAFGAAEAMFFGSNGLQAEKFSWVLSRLHFKIFRAPVWKEAIEVSTWSKGPYGPFYLRDFIVKTKEGEILISCTTSWLILDLAERRMVRTSELIKEVPESSLCMENAIETPADKISMPKDIEPAMAGTRLVSYSDTDLLGHANSTKYLIWAMDSVDQDIMVSRPVKEVRINYNHEIRPGQEVSLYTSHSGDSYFVEGKVEGKSAFCVRLDF